MFKFFKTTPQAAKAIGPKPATRRPTGTGGARPTFDETQPMPHVVEGNEQSDWALWEDSMMVMDSQMQSLTPSARIYERDRETPSEYQDIDPFARIGKKSA